MSTLHEQAASAYHARLYADEDGAVLVTPMGFTTLRAGQPPREHAVSLGSVAVLDDDALVFWRSGRLRKVSLSTNDEHELVAVARAPRYLLASEGRLAWIQTTRGAGTSLQTLTGGEARVVHEGEDSISAAVMRGAAVYWVSESRNGSWTIGRVDLDGSARLSTRARTGRAPAMLALGRDGVYFYDGPQRGVRRLTFDLEDETAVLAHVICSPLVASSRVLCAHVGGLFEIPAAAQTARFLASERAGPITTLAATDQRAYWVAESGDERLTVRSIELDEP